MIGRRGQSASTSTVLDRDVELVLSREQPEKSE
jgi:hypothetical protein